MATCIIIRERANFLIAKMLIIFEKILLIIISALSLWFGFWVYSQKKEEKMNQWFLLATLSILGWVNFAHFGSNSTDVNLSAFLYRVNYGIVLLFIFSFYKFINYYSKREFSFFENIILGGLILLSFLTFLTDLVIKETIIKEWGAEVVFGQLGLFYKFFAFFVTLIILKNLFVHYSLISNEEKKKIQYFFIGVVFFAIGNIVFNVIIPVTLNTVKFQHFGDFSAIFLLGFTAYAIVNKELFGMKVVLTQIFIVVLAILLFVQIVLTPSLELRFINGIALVFFLFFGIYLIKAVRNEEERRKKAELIAEKEKRLREESEELIKEFKKLSDAKNQFIMATQHHLRTPLTAMRGYLDLIFGGTYGKVPRKMKDVLDRFQVSTMRLIRMVNEFLDISQFQLGKEVVFLKPKGRIEPILKEMEEELKFQSEDKGIKLEIKIPRKKLPYVKADIEKLKAAFFNIADNAIKYTTKGSVKIKTEVLDKKIRVHIEDTGIGLLKEEQERLFSRLFERGTEAREKFSMGRGIGLYLSYQIVKAHDGKLWAESEGKGKGSTFIFELPIDEE